jgi:hypothetical protein
VNWSAGWVTAEVPPTVVTVTSTVPPAALGEAARQLVVEEQVTFAEAVMPKSTVVVPSVAKLVPVIVTGVPPPIGPEIGLIALTLGGAT